MAYIKALFFLAVVVAAVTAAEEAAREKKAVFYGTDDGQWAPGKYEGVAYTHPAVPLAYSSYHHPVAAPGAYPYHAAYRSFVY